MRIQPLEGVAMKTIKRWVMVARLKEQGLSDLDSVLNRLAKYEKALIDIAQAPERLKLNPYKKEQMGIARALNAVATVASKALKGELNG